MINECGAVGGMRTSRGSQVLRKKTHSSSTFPLQIPHDLTQDWIPAAMVENQQLIT
jgi:hypothetical protein